MTPPCVSFDRYGGLRELIVWYQGEELSAPTTRSNLPLLDSYVHEAPRQITDEEREFEAYRTLRQERGRARNEGQRKVREAKVSC